MQERMSTIGLYDSGIGGLSVLRAVRAVLPRHDLLYLADSAFCPYGPLPYDAVCERAYRCVEWLQDQGAGVVVVACNTATSAAMEMLRAEFALPLVGMEPGIKPAIAATRSGHIGVLATGGTLAGERFASLVQRFARNVNVTMIPSPGLVAQVEAGDLTGAHTRALLQHYLEPLKASKVDTIVLGCSHFHFLTPTITALAGPHITIIDTSPAVAKQTARMAAQARVLPGSGALRCATSGAPEQVAAQVTRLWGAALPVEHAAC